MDYSHKLLVAQQTHPSYEDEDQSPSFKSSLMTFSKGHDNDEHKGEVWKTSYIVKW